MSLQKLSDQVSAAIRVLRDLEAAGHRPESALSAVGSIPIITLPDRYDKGDGRAAFVTLPKYGGPRKGELRTQERRGRGTVKMWELRVDGVAVQWRSLEND